jgi:hypothetical protein
MKKKLTVGMATYDDYHGVYFTIQSLRMYHPMNDVEILVIDNNPESAHGKETATFVKNWAKGKYIPFIDKASTSTRDEIFHNAEGTYTLCLDCHVLIEKGGIEALLKYYDENPDTKNLVQGPLLYDDLQNYSTHFKPEWRDSMYGTWETDKDGYESGKPFEIPMQGLGLFSCRTDNWPGFNKLFRGFGGEEGYIHEKIRQKGGTCICLPDLKWNHRFGRPDGIKYPLRIEDRVWNYIIGGMELYRDEEHPYIKSIVDHFTPKIPEKLLKNYISIAKCNI